ncbi:DNA-3-methyladenine glycosylase [Pedobacter foliorum]|uniref:DNA-3-methyladenine glycosylase family protein n=1 Tax=Pedobacter foliorum TaxID=2739058 RepID=UPI0015678325|nr:DNA-3-methyladenine glycosylase 2 family protein [Pedobacter foliorum]NRF39905.1 DNA-3-methyladenine glycosylase 2 family protein [Pedobacter foliorum]
MSKQIISIDAPLNFDFQECLWFLDRNFDDCMHKVDTDQVIKVVEIEGQQLLVSVAFYEHKLQIELLDGNLKQPDLNKLKKFVSDWFDLEKDMESFYLLIKNDERLAYMATAYNGLRLIGIPNLFEAICWAIIGQQINLTFAYKLKRRLVEKYGAYMSYNGFNYHVFPNCEVLAELYPDDLKEMQFSKSKAEYLINIAKAFASGEISKDKLLALPDLIARQKALNNIKGIGVWTANYALMKSLKEHSCVPYGDAGLLNSLLNHKIIADKKQHKEIELFFSNYPGWESYLVFYLWRSLSTKC